jgi:hypothetical protein
MTNHERATVNAIDPQTASMLNMAFVHDLETRIGKALDPPRFRAKLLITGMSPWMKLDLLYRELAAGGLRFKGARLTRRCPATEVNPETALRDTCMRLKAVFSALVMPVTNQMRSASKGVWT